MKLDIAKLKEIRDEILGWVSFLDTVANSIAATSFQSGVIKVALGLSAALSLVWIVRRSRKSEPLKRKWQPLTWIVIVAFSSWIAAPRLMKIFKHEPMISEFVGPLKNEAARAQPSVWKQIFTGTDPKALTLYLYPIKFDHPDLRVTHQIADLMAKTIDATDAGIFSMEDLLEMNLSRTPAVGALGVKGSCVRWIPDDPTAFCVRLQLVRYSTQGEVALKEAVFTNGSLSGDYPKLRYDLSCDKYNDFLDDKYRPLFQEGHTPAGDCDLTNDMSCYWRAAMKDGRSKLSASARVVKEVVVEETQNEYRTFITYLTSPEAKYNTCADAR